ncbi:hypothetical protein PAXRUDRAFT_825847 [Paxillus rubicundulus Ve08.2h10]|uniref:Unplaced genomic scaffold scaffold_159, whole genome shotgun sequence n=1 Tax=Paxillus rubicundulus Ve08.2h10 TaxID=930991 RepID=A0A0D0E5B9_9AGAM|nr:hypothetical protein PAXRUDRAFT_825847 [Paxillus rubicundulus Ve08.2h10]
MTGGIYREVLNPFIFQVRTSVVQLKRSHVACTDYGLCKEQHSGRPPSLNVMVRLARLYLPGKWDFRASPTIGPVFARGTEPCRVSGAYV